MLQKDFEKAVQGHDYATIVSYDVFNNFTSESIIAYLNSTYGCNVVGITGDPAWYGRGTVYGSGLDDIPAEWEDALPEGYGCLEMIDAGEIWED